jgi:hypothetical protein
MDTSGVLLAAKNAATASLINAQFQDKRVSKAYLSICLGAPQQPCFTADGPIGQHPAVHVARRVHPDGQPAVTHVQVRHTCCGLPRMNVRSPCFLMVSTCFTDCKLFPLIASNPRYKTHVLVIPSSLGGCTAEDAQSTPTYLPWHAVVVPAGIQRTKKSHSLTGLCLLCCPAGVVRQHCVPAECTRQLRANTLSKQRDRPCRSQLGTSSRA